MDPLTTIATDRQRHMQAIAANERIANELRRARPRRSPTATVATLLRRMRDTAPAPAPCPTC